jgi:hypothetical protein
VKLAWLAAGLFAVTLAGIVTLVAVGWKMGVFGRELVNRNTRVTITGKFGTAISDTAGYNATISDGKRSYLCTFEPPLTYQTFRQLKDKAVTVEGIENGVDKAMKMTRLRNCTIR